MGTGLLTIIVFNFERIFVISQPLHLTWFCKKWCRRNRYTVIVGSFLMNLTTAYVAHLDTNFKTCDLYTSYIFINNYVIILLFALTGAIYILGSTIMLPCLSIILVYQIRKVMQNSKKIRSENQTNATATIQNVRLHLGQILIASYTFICLFPNVIYFLRFQGKFICLI